jgi:hypothetical protein
MADAIFNRAAELDSPAWSAAAVVPSADADLPLAPTRAVYVGGAGNLAVIMAGGGTVTFSGVAAGTILPIRVDRIVNTSTATLILALY